MNNPFAEVKSSKSFALARINRILGRAQAGALAVTAIEPLFNGMQQSSNLNQVWFWVMFGSFAVVVVGVQISQWGFNDGRIFFRAHAILILVLVVSWPLQVQNPDLLPVRYEPWVWWTLGMAGLSAVLSFSMTKALIYLAALPTLWAFMHMSEWGGSASEIMAWQESTYTFLVSGTFGAVILLLRGQASQVDLANELAARAAANKARVDAIERERYRIDSLMHDKVLTALLLAAKAKTHQDEVVAAALAAEAILNLNSARSEEFKVPVDLTVSSFFLSLEDVISHSYPEVSLVVLSGSDLELPAHVAEAITDATLQAVQNSVQHAGGSSVVRSVRFKAKPNGLKIVVIDNGKGFRVSNVAKNRLGVRLSILAKVENAGGRVFIDSKPREGTNVVIEWSQND